MEVSLRHNADVARIWHNYHEELTGSDYIGYDAHGSLFGFIAEKRPDMQGEILNILYEAGFEAGVRDAFYIRDIVEEGRG